MVREGELGRDVCVRVCFVWRDGHEERDGCAWDGAEEGRRGGQRNSARARLRSHALGAPRPASAIGTRPPGWARNAMQLRPGRVTQAGAADPGRGDAARRRHPPAPAPPGCGRERALPPFPIPPPARPASSPLSSIASLVRSVHTYLAIDGRGGGRQVDGRHGGKEEGSAERRERRGGGGTPSVFAGVRARAAPPRLASTRSIEFRAPTPRPPTRQTLPPHTPRHHDRRDQDDLPQPGPHRHQGGVARRRAGRERR